MARKTVPLLCHHLPVNHFIVSLSTMEPNVGSVLKLDRCLKINKYEIHTGFCGESVQNAK